MKSLVEFIHENETMILTSFIAESMIINEAFYFFKPSQNAAKVEDAIKSFLNTSKKRYSFNNKQDREKFFKAFLDFSKLDNKLLREFKITDGTELANLITKNKEKLEEAKWNLKCISSFDETELQKEYKEWKKSKDYVEGHNFNKNDYKEDNEDDLVRTLIVYSGTNPADKSTTLEYDFSGKRGKNTKHQENMIKMDWHYITGLKYFDARTILLTNYLKKSEEELKAMGAYSDDIIGKMD